MMITTLFNGCSTHQSYMDEHGFAAYGLPWQLPIRLLSETDVPYLQ